VVRWGVAVVGVFELVAGHLAFDDRAWAARGEQFVDDLGGDADFRVVDRLRGKTGVAGGRSACGPQ
jgi:hypothetical protein